MSNKASAAADHTAAAADRPAAAEPSSWPALDWDSNMRKSFTMADGGLAVMNNRVEHAVGDDGHAGEVIGAVRSRNRGWLLCIEWDDATITVEAAVSLRDADALDDDDNESYYWDAATRRGDYDGW